MASLRRSPAEPPGGDEQRGEGTDEPDRLDGKRLKVLITAEVHAGADDADGRAGGQEAADEGVERRQQRLRHRAARGRVPRMTNSVQVGMMAQRPTRTSMVEQTSAATATSAARASHSSGNGP